MGCDTGGALVCVCGAGGHVDGGESDLEAAIRECQVKCAPEEVSSYKKSLVLALVSFSVELKCMKLDVSTRVAASVLACLYDRTLTANDRTLSNDSVWTRPTGSLLPAARGCRPPFPLHPAPQAS